MLKNNRNKNKQITIFLENFIVLFIFIVIGIFLFAIMREYYIYNIVGAAKYHGITQPLPLTHEELVELLKTKGIKACKEWPRDYPTLEERPCYIQGIDKDGDKYCDVVTTKEQHHSGLTNHLCKDFWNYIKNK